MNTLGRAAILCALFAGFPGSRAQAQFNKLETEHMRLIYIDALQSFLVPHVARCFENAYQYHQGFWGYKTDEKVTVLLFDVTDFGNAGAGAAPENRIMVMVAPASYAYETLPANERMNATMNHEMVHIVAFDKATGRDRFFRTLFGGKVNATSDNPLSLLYSHLTMPRLAAPRWYHEGIAVFMETWMSGGLGRALGAYDEMVFRTMVLEGDHFYDPIGLESEGTKIDFQVGVNAYLYGTRFVSYLALRYGTDPVIDWFSRTAGSRGHFGSQFKHVFGMSLDDEWQHWIEWEQEFQRVNLDSIRQYPTTGYRELSGHALGSMSRGFYDPPSGKLYVGVDYPGRVAHLVAIDRETGEMERLHDIKGSAVYFVTSLVHDPSTRTLFYVTDNNAWRDLVAFDLERHQSRMLIKDVRTGDLAFNPVDKSLWGVRHYNGISTLVRIPHPYDEWNQVYSWPYGRDMYDLDISPDGKWLTAALAEVSGRQTLIAMDVPGLLAGDTSYATLFDFGLSLPAQFVFSPDGQYLYGASYYSGVSNIFRYDFARDSMEAVTNCETGMFHPIPYGGDSLIAFRYTSNGFVPVILRDTIIEDVSPIKFLGQEVVEARPIVKEWIAGSPADIDLDPLIVDSGSYRPVKHIGLSSVYPIVEGYKTYAGAGLRAEFEDPVGFHHSSLTASYTPASPVPSDERWHVSWEHTYLNWNLDFNYNGADFYDLFGPTRTSRKGFAAGVNYKKTLVYDRPRTMDYRVGVSGYWNLERLPDYQNVATSYGEFATLSAALNYSNSTASIGAVDHEKGTQWRLRSNNTYVNRELHPLVSAGFDLGIPLFIPHSSLWLHTAAGYSPGERDDPFDNFFFGGFGNNWVDVGAIKRYRQSSSFPGTELNAIAGTNYGKLMLEWTLPPWRFRHVGTSMFYLTYARPALFATGLVTNMDDDGFRQKVANVGGQLDFRFALMTHYRMTFSIGYAVAMEHGFRSTDEWMFSLKVM